jgi:type IV pilus assembly protein PilP
MSKRVRWFVLASAATLAGCGEDEPPPPPAAATGMPADTPVPGGAPAAAGKGKSKAAEPTDLPPLPTPDIQERDFLESPANRDPYKTYADLFIIRPKTEQVTIQREVLIQKHSLESLKIVGIVTGTSGRCAQHGR